LLFFSGYKDRHNFRQSRRVILANLEGFYANKKSPDRKDYFMEMKIKTDNENNKQSDVFN